MDATTPCPNCKHINPENSLFCNNCGSDLVGNIDNRLKLYETRIQDMARKAEAEAYTNIKKWLTVSTWTISIALTIIGATVSVGAYLGFDSILDFRKTIDSQKVQAEQTIKDIEKDIKIAEGHIKKLDEAQGIVDEIKGLKSELSIKLSKTNDYYQDALKLRNGLFNINLHLDSSLSDRERLKTTITSGLVKEGFLIDTDKILDLKVDQTEIIYYNYKTKDKANEIARHIKALLKLNDLEPREIKRPNHYRYDILIKLNKITP